MELVFWLGGGSLEPWLSGGLGMLVTLGGGWQVPLAKPLCLGKHIFVRWDAY